MQTAARRNGASDNGGLRPWPPVFESENDMTEPRRGIRARRDGWAEKVKAAVTPRDIEILYLTGTCGVVRTRDIARFFFGSRGTANDRLRKLYCAGLLDCHVPDLAGDNLYTLTALGRDRVLDAHGLDADALSVVRKLPKKLGHALAITEVRLHVAIACRESALYELASFETDADLAAERHRALLDLIPDAKVGVRHRATGEAYFFFAELDLGTEAVTWLVRRKLAAYARHAQLGTSLYGLRDPLVVVVTTGLRRARNAARMLTDARVGARVVFAAQSSLDETNVLGAAYALPADLLAPDGTDASSIFRQSLLP